MRSVQSSGAGAPTIITLQTGAIRRRITASESVAALVASLAYGEPRRGDLGALASVTSARVASYVEARS